jgi:trigger factor
MEINKQEISKNHLVIKVSLFNEDYKNQVNEKMKLCRKTANFPGFRKGQVPPTLIEKRYKTSFISEEIKILLNKAIENYILENSLNLLANPLQIHQDEITSEQKPLNFEFEIGLKPKILIDLKKIQVTYYEIELTKEELENHINKLRENLGEIKEKENVDISSKVQGEISFLKDQQKSSSFELENNNYTFDIKELSLESQNKILKAKIDQEIQFDSGNLFEDEKKNKDFLEKSQEFIFKIKKIVQINLAELNQEFFKKVYHQENIETIEKFQEKIKEELSSSYQKQVDYFLFNEIIEKLIKNTDFELPKEFLLKWIANENPDLTQEEINQEYKKSEPSLKYQLIENKLIEEFHIKITKEDLEEGFNKWIISQYKKMGIEILEEKIKETSQILMKDKKQIEALSKDILQEKMIAVFKENINLEIQKISWEDFIEKIKIKQT